MSLATIRIILLSVGWPLLVVSSVYAYRAAAFFTQESQAPFARRVYYAIVALIVTLFAFSAAMSIFMMLSDTGVLAALGITVVLTGTLSVLIYRSGHRIDIMEEHRAWLAKRIDEAALKQGNEMQSLMQQQAASTEESVKNLERTKSALLNVMEDLNQEKADAMESQSRVSAILDGIADGIITIDDEGRVFLVNPIIEAWTGLKRAALIGRPWSEVFILTDDRGESAMDSFNALLVAGSEIKGTHHDYVLKSGSQTIPVSVGVSPVEFSGHRAGSVVVFRDVTVERRIDRAKSEFISVASHQLRTPLTSMNWYIESVLNKDFGKVPAAFVEPLETVHFSGRRLASLINALLNVSRIEMGHLRITPAPIDLNALCDEVVKESTPTIVEKDLKVQMTHGDIPQIPLDLNLVKIVVQNLIANAIRYTPSKGSVTIGLSKEGDKVTLAVTDTGVGIPKAQQGSVFKKMFRADNAVKTVPDGTGLGLYISKSIIEQFGGDISFVSKEGSGTTFKVRFPVAGATAREGEQTLLAERMI